MMSRLKTLISIQYNYSAVFDARFFYKDFIGAGGGYEVS